MKSAPEWVVIVKKPNKTNLGKKSCILLYLSIEVVDFIAKYVAEYIDVMVISI